MTDGNASRFKPGNARRGSAAMASVQATFAKSGLRSRFGHRDFSDRVVEALIDAGVQYPERLLLMEMSVIKALPGIGKAALAEIEAYRETINRAVTAKSVA